MHGLWRIKFIPSQVARRNKRKISFAENWRVTLLVFVIHGGGWQGGSKERINRFVDVKYVLEAGISVAAINYRYVAQASDSEMDPPGTKPFWVLSHLI